MSSSSPAPAIRASAGPTSVPEVQNLQTINSSSTSSIDPESSDAPLAVGDGNLRERHLSNGTGPAPVASVNSDDSKKKRRHRRGKRRRYKPYHKLTVEEKIEQEERERKRAEKMRADRFAHGQPMAPYNTTQFLLEDREARNLEPNVEELIESLQGTDAAAVVERERTYSGSNVGSETSETGSGHSALSDNSDLEREFEQEYEQIHADRLESMSKQDLVREYLTLENELEKTNDQNGQMRKMVCHLKLKVGQLKAENCQLQAKMTSDGALLETNPENDSGLAMRMDERS